MSIISFYLTYKCFFPTIATLFYFLYIGKHLFINNQIRVPTVRLIDENGEQKGIIALEKALELARGQELDLILVAPNANPPVCKIADWGKHLYKERKVERKHRASQKQAEVKGIRLSLRTGEHDIDVKVAQARRFIADRHSIKVQLIFRGREIAHESLAREKMLTFAQKLTDVASMDMEPKKQGYSLIMTLSPLK